LFHAYNTRNNPTLPYSSFTYEHKHFPNHFEHETDRNKPYILKTRKDLASLTWKMLTQANEILSGLAPKAEANNGTENSKG